MTTIGESIKLSGNPRYLEQNNEFDNTSKKKVLYLLEMKMVVLMVVRLSNLATDSQVSWKLSQANIRSLIIYPTYFLSINLYWILVSSTRMHCIHAILSRDT